MNGASSRRLDDGLGFLYRGELLLRCKEIVRRRFLRIGQNDQRLRHEKGRTMNSSEQNTYPRWPDQYSSTDGQRKFRSAKYFLCFALRF
jgi:hypothetical protein